MSIRIFLFFLLPSVSFAASIVPPDQSRCPVVYDMYAKNKGRALSCTRTREKQNQLIRFFMSLGRPGQAGKNSRHIFGCACDFSTHLPEKSGFHKLRSKGHRGNHYSDTGR